VWLDCFDTEKYGSGRVCVGGTPTRRFGGSKALSECELVDDNQWHKIILDARVIREVFPAVKYLHAFQFYTQENGREGHEFWIDDFSVEGDVGSSG